MTAGIEEFRFGYYRKRPLLCFLAHNKKVPHFLREKLRSAFRSLKADVQLDGVKFRCYPNQNNHDLSIVRGTLFRKEEEEYRFMEACLKNGGCFVDAGAHTGAICIPLALRCPAIDTVIAIEPNPVNIERLQYNAALNGVHNIEIKPYAVGQAGKVKLWINSPTNSGQSSLHAIQQDFGFIEVEAKPLLDILKEAGVTSIDLLKIDIEGYEDRALMPFFRDAPHSRWPKAINIEHVLRSLWQDDCIDAMKSLGYEIKTVTKSNTILVLR